MPLQAFNTNPAGTKFHNMFSPQIVTNSQCYLNSQIQTAKTTILDSFGDRFSAVSADLGFTPEFSRETLTVPSTTTRFVIMESSSCQIRNGLNAYQNVGITQSSLVSNAINVSTFVVADSKMIAYFSFNNNGTTLVNSFSTPVIRYFGIANDPLFNNDLANTDLCNYFLGVTANAYRLLNMTTSTLATLAINGLNFSYQCSLNTGDGTDTSTGLWATHIPLIDSVSPFYCIGTMSPILLLGKGSFVTGSLYNAKNVGHGKANTNAYDRTYVCAGPVSSGSLYKLLMEVYYED